MPEPLILRIVQALKQHFLYPYKTVNASRLPVIAIHSIYATLLPEAKIHQDRKLAPLNNPKGIGDIEIFDGESRRYEAIAIKPRPITLNMINAVPKKIKGKQVKRYSLLTMNQPYCVDEKRINSKIEIIEEVI
ncbi:MAG: hypothetical protein HZB17_14155, partial [Chloroflexi bacterium]|nr:hypothetical protein [Chloroflexota bacterium]